jgi:enoyl-CoA hydratase/carnithine racemase
MIYIHSVGRALQYFPQHTALLREERAVSFLELDIRVRRTAAALRRLGIIPDYGVTQRLPRLVGKGRALQLILTGDLIDAHEAYRIGLVNEVVPTADLISRCEAMLKQIDPEETPNFAASIERHALKRSPEGSH